MAFARALNLGQAQCVFVEIKELTTALAVRGYLKDPTETYDEEVETAFQGWFAQSGIDPGWFGLQVSPAGVSSVEICPAEAWHQLAAEAAGAESGREMSPGAPASSPPSAPAPLAPPAPQEPVPAPRVQAGFAPEKSIWAWFFVASVVGATYLYVRYDRKHRGR